MRFKEFDASLVKPIRKTSLTKLEAEFTEFINMNVECVKCIFGDSEYVSVDSAYNCLHKAARKLGVPIRVSRRKGEIYLVRTDV